MRVIAGLIPPGGFHFRQKLRSSPQRPQHQIIRSESYDGLLDAVLKFRINNLEMVASGSATPEHVEHDIQYFICGKWPQNCTGSRAQMQTVAAGNIPRFQPGGRPDYVRPLTRIEDWLTILNERGLKWVDQARALERAKVCLKCPLNQKWKTGCGSCNENAARRATLVRGSHTTGLEGKLNSCLSYGTLLELSIWLENDHSGPRRQPPDHCWKLTEAKV